MKLVIKKLTLKNFEKHERLIIDFNSVLTVLQGPSDVGKSSIIRALLWCLRNVGTPAKLINNKHPKDVMEVIVELGDGSRIHRIWQKNRLNEYRITKDKYEPQILKAVGIGKVPEAVKALLDITDLNIKIQKDQFFMLDDKPSELMEKLNDVFDFSELVELLELAEKETKAIEQESKITDKNLSKRSKELKSLSWVEPANNMYRTWEEMVKEYESKKDRAEQLQSSITDARTLRDNAHRLATVSSINIEKLKKALVASAKLAREINETEYGVQEAKHTRNRLETDLPESLLASETPQELRKVVDKVSKYDTLVSMLKSLDRIGTVLDSMDSALAQSFNTLGELKGRIAVISNITEIINRAEDTKLYHRKLRQFEQLNQCVTNIDRLSTLTKSVYVSRGTIEELTNNIRKLLQSESEIQSVSDSIHELERKRKEIESGLETCPKCGAYRIHWRV